MCKISNAVNKWNYYFCDEDNILSFYMLQKCSDITATKKVDI